ncbi:unnamed protein product [Mytilus edulis]|uniref:CARD domain-containing protein n=1 Tax=Mytilus edulis TaxID=6550 RepID=A0A8S3QUT2_MYTED|nr:unnamed protein product [Mytilus edulis]
MNTNASQVVSIEQDEHGFDMIDAQQGKNVPVSSLIDKTDDATLSPSAQSLKFNVVSDSHSGVPQLEKDAYRKQKKGEGGLTSYKLETTKIRKLENIGSRPTQRVIKNQKQHGLFPYYDELINQTVLDKMVLDNLISRCILMIEDREEIIKPTTQRERNKVLLDILTDRPYDVNDNAIRMQKNYTLLVNNIVSTTDVTDYLIGEDIMQHEEREEVCASGLTTNESNRRLLDKLLYKDRNGYHQLLKALRHAEYLQIANEVSNTAVTELDQKLYRIGITKFRDRQDSQEEMFEDFQFIRSTIEKLASTQDDVIPKNILERLLKDWDTGYVCNVSNNTNMNASMFLERFINNLNKLDQSKQEKLACTQDINNTDIALSGSCSMGTVDLEDDYSSLSMSPTVSNQDRSSDRDLEDIIPDTPESTLRLNTGRNLFDYIQDIQQSVKELHQKIDKEKSSALREEIKQLIQLEMSRTPTALEVRMAKQHIRKKFSMEYRPAMYRTRIVQRRGNIVTGTFWTKVRNLYDSIEEKIPARKLAIYEAFQRKDDRGEGNNKVYHDQNKIECSSSCFIN